MLEGVGSSGALGGVGRQAVGVNGLHGRVSVGLMRDAGESVDDRRDDAGYSGGGDVGWWRTEACWEKGWLLSTSSGSLRIILQELYSTQTYTSRQTPFLS